MTSFGKQWLVFMIFLESMDNNSKPFEVEIYLVEGGAISD